MAAQPQLVPGGTVVRAGAALRRLRSATREAHQALREVEHLQEADLWGHYALAAGEGVSGELLAWLRAAAADNEGKALVVHVVVPAQE